MESASRQGSETRWVHNQLPSGCVGHNQGRYENDAQLDKEKRQNWWGHQLFFPGFDSEGKKS